MSLILRELTSQDEFAFHEGRSFWPPEDADWHSFAWKEGMLYQDMLEILRKEALGIDLRADRVPHTMLYAFVDGKIVGRVSVRHELNEHLRYRGGHIGYAVSPPFRQRGYATEMVRQALEFCRKLRIESVMVTCADDNVPSWKLVEKHSGVLEDRIWDDVDKEMIRRYWIRLK